VGTEVTVSKRPPCDLCGEPAHYDSRTRQGSWAYLCEAHWRRLGLGTLGTGFGQRLVLESEVSTDKGQETEP